MGEINISQEELQEKLDNSYSKCNQDCGNCEEYNDEEYGLEDRNYSKEEVESLIQETINQVYEEIEPKIKLDIKGLTKTDGFQKGLELASKYCGMYVALVNVGINKEDVGQIILNQQTIDHNEKLNKETCENNLKVAEKQQIQIEKGSI